MSELAEQRKWATETLQQAYEKLGRLPQKGDFDEGTRARIKAFLGPWPRALETAGLKHSSARQPRRTPHMRKSRIRSEGLDGKKQNAGTHSNETSQEEK